MEVLQDLELGSSEKKAKDDSALQARGVRLSVMNDNADDEVLAAHQFLQKEWTAERGLQEEAKIAQFPPPTFIKNWC